ncbi:MAG: TldD/PmbA family protein [Gammaproteobacteria bacterium]|nr:TldD/PmbA family protein [Gammaproteobacteria bacterium]
MSGSNSTLNMGTTQMAEQVLEQVINAGASGDLIIDEGEALSLKARDGELEEYKVSSSRIFGLRVIKDGHIGTAYSEAVDADALNSMVGQALDNARFVKVEPHENILPSSDHLKTDDELLCPQELVSVEQKIQMTLEIEGRLAAKDKVKNVPYNGVQDITSQRHIFSSAGLNAATRSRMCAAYAYALVEDGENNAMQGASQVSRHFHGLNASSVIDRTYEKCIGLLDGKPVPSKHYDVIFDKDCQVSVFGVFAMMFSGKAAKDGINPMREKTGSVIADSRLSIYDQPLNVDGFGYHLFDAEGTATKKSGLIVEGCLQTLIHNSATASYFDTETTGHASRGPRSTLGVSLHQVEIAKGSEDQTTLHSGEYLELTDLSGLHSGANAISGDFSFGASGYLCRDGERIQAVRGITVAGNFYEMLNKISMIGDQQHWDEGRSALMPGIRFADVAISG